MPSRPTCRVRRYGGRNVPYGAAADPVKSAAE